MSPRVPDIRREVTLDDLILELAATGKSREEISQRIGGALTPERVDQRVKQILAAPDWLTDIQQQRAMLRLMQTNIIQLRDEWNLDSAKLQLY